MLGPVPCTVTVPDSEVVVVLPPLLPQPRPATSNPTSIAANATCRRRSLHSKDSELRRLGMMRAISSRQVATKAGPGHPSSGRNFCGSGKFDAKDEAVIVTIAVLLLLSAPTGQVTPTSVLEVLQEKLTLLPERPFIGVKVSVDVPLFPAFNVKVLGEALSEKSGGTVVKLETLDQAPYTPLEGDKAFTCQ